MNYPEPYILTLPKVGESNIGFLSIAENDELPFQIARVFWTYFTPESVIRGRHAHYETQQLLFAVNGRIIVATDDGKGDVRTFILDEPNKAVYIPPNVWHTMQYSHTATQMVFASHPYQAKDYIRDYNQFTKHWCK